MRVGGEVESLIGKWIAQFAVAYESFLMKLS